MNTRQKKNKEIVEKMTQLIKELDLEHPDGLILIANLDDEDQPGRTHGVVAAAGCRHGFEMGIYAALAQEEEIRSAFKRANKKFKEIGSLATQTLNREEGGRTSRADQHGVPKNPVPKGHPLHGILEMVREAALDANERMKKEKAN